MAAKRSAVAIVSLLAAFSTHCFAEVKTHASPIWNSTTELVKACENITTVVRRNTNTKDMVRAMQCMAYLSGVYYALRANSLVCWPEGGINAERLSQSFLSYVYDEKSGSGQGQWIARHEVTPVLVVQSAFMKSFACKK